MAATLQPGTVEKVETFRSLISADEAGKKDRKKHPPIWEFLPTISKQDWSEGKYEIALYRYHPQTEKKIAVEKLFESIDPFEVQKRYGGGSFNVMVKEDGQLIYNQDFLVEGEPKVFTPSANGNGRGGAANGADAIALEAMRMASNPDFQRLQMDMMRAAMVSALEMVKMQQPTAQDPLQTLRNAKEILGIGAPAPNPMDDITKAFMTAAIQKMLNPPETNALKDTVQFINDAKAAGLLGGAAPKTDVMGMLAGNLPMIADRLVSGFHEFRLQAEATERTVRMQRGEMRPNDPNVITLPPPGYTDNPAPQPQPQPAQAAPQPQPAAPAQRTTLTQEEVQNIIMRADLERLVRAMKEPNCTGEDIASYLSHVFPAMLNEMAKNSKSELLLFFKSRDMQIRILGNDVLCEMADDPRLPRMIDEFLAAVKREHPPAPPAATTPLV
jgi:hypothetical protein